MRWSRSNLSAKRYVYFWVDGIHVRARTMPSACWSSSVPRSRAIRTSSATGITDNVVRLGVSPSIRAGSDTVAARY